MHNKDRDSKKSRTKHRVSINKIIELQFKKNNVFEPGKSWMSSILERNNSQSCIKY